MEAYAVLSVVQSRANYDLLRQKDPRAFKEVSQREFDRTYNTGARDASGGLPVQAPAKGSYAEERLQELKEARKKYNVNHLGYYRGGVPQKGRGAVRGEAIMPPGYFHQPKVHNFLNFYHPDSKIIDSEETIKFKAFMHDDKDDYQMARPSHVLHYDRTKEFLKDRSFWLLLLLGMGTFGYV